jgi:hypothetical protein
MKKHTSLKNTVILFVLLTYHIYKTKNIDIGR